MISTPVNWNRSTIKRAPDLKKPSVYCDTPIHPSQGSCDGKDGKRLSLFPDLLNKIAPDGTKCAYGIPNYRKFKTNYFLKMGFADIFERTKIDRKNALFHHRSGSANRARHRSASMEQSKNKS